MVKVLEVVAVGVHCVSLVECVRWRQHSAVERRWRGTRFVCVTSQGRKAAAASAARIKEPSIVKALKLIGNMPD